MVEEDKKLEEMNDTKNHVMSQYYRYLHICSYNKWNVTIICSDDIQIETIWWGYGGNI